MLLDSTNFKTRFKSYYRVPLRLKDKTGETQKDSVSIKEVLCSFATLLVLFLAPKKVRFDPAPLAGVSHCPCLNPSLWIHSSLLGYDIQGWSCSSPLDLLVCPLLSYVCRSLTEQPGRLSSCPCKPSSDQKHMDSPLLFDRASPHPIIVFSFVVFETTLAFFKISMCCTKCAEVECGREEGS